MASDSDKERNPFHAAFVNLVGAAGWSSMQKAVHSFLLWELKNTMSEYSQLLAQSVINSKGVTILDHHFDAYFSAADGVTRRVSAHSRPTHLRQTKHDKFVEMCYNSVIQNDLLLLSIRPIKNMLKEMVTEIVHNHPSCKGLFECTKDHDHTDGCSLVRVADEVPRRLAVMVQRRLMGILRVTKPDRLDKGKELNVKTLYHARELYYQLVPRRTYVSSDTQLPACVMRVLEQSMQKSAGKKRSSRRSSSSGSIF